MSPPAGDVVVLQGQVPNPQLCVSLAAYQRPVKLSARGHSKPALGPHLTLHPSALRSTAGNLLLPDSSCQATDMLTDRRRASERERTRERGEIRRGQQTREEKSASERAIEREGVIWRRGQIREGEKERKQVQRTEMQTPDWANKEAVVITPL